MTMDRAYVNAGEGFACCCWNAPSRRALEELFDSAEVAYEKIREVEEYLGG